MNRVYFGDCRASLQKMIDAGIKAQMCVTSPPYFGLRNYGVDGQLGLEQTPDEYVASMVEVFRLVRDVLEEDATLWLNLGDSFGKKKQLLGIPWRVAFALQADGWYLRAPIIWHKPKCLPGSQKDRPTIDYETVFLFSKNQNYFYDHEAMKEPVAESTKARMAQDIEQQPGSSRANAGGKTNGNMKAVGDGQRRAGRAVWSISPKGYKGAHFAVFPLALAEKCIIGGSSAGGHCSHCGKRRERIIEKGAPLSEWQRQCGGDKLGEYHGQAQKDYAAANAQNASAVKARILAGMVERKTIGWRAECGCSRPAAADFILDPFLGSGTTGEAAINLGRQFIGCELNRDYQPLIAERIAKADGDALYLFDDFPAQAAQKAVL